MSLVDEGLKIDKLLAMEYDNWLQQLSGIDALIKEQDEILRSDEVKTDRSENAVYQNAIDTKQQALMEKAILENMITKYKTTFQEYSTEGYKPQGFIKVGSVVKIKCIDMNRDFIVKVVPGKVAVPRLNAVAITCPLGRALLNKVAGEVAECRTIRGNIHYYIEEVY